MAAYLVSLERLGLIRRRRSREGLLQAASRVPIGGVRAPLSGAEDAASRSENGRLAVARPETRAPTEDPKGGDLPGEVDGFATVQDLLDVPKEQIEAWLKTHGGSEARVLLAMLCRLASLEARLSELEGPTGGRKSLAASSLPPAVNLAPNREPVKSDLLEQVFQKNLSLRRNRIG